MAACSEPFAGRHRVLAVAIGHGGLAGCASAVTLWAMHAVEHLVWGVSDARWYIPVAILAGGTILALLRRHGTEQSVEAQLQEAANPVSVNRRRTAVLAFGAVVAVGFGGAVGPEAGLLAVAAELSALVSARLGRSLEEQRAIGQAGAGGALAGWYASPPGAASLDDDTLRPGRLLSVLAATAGIGGFFLTNGAIGGAPAGIHLPSYEASPAQAALAVLPGLAGCAVALLFIGAHRTLGRLLALVGGPARQTLLATVLFALLAAALPLVRFSGHEDLHEVVSLVSRGSWTGLLTLATAKALAVALNLAGGWRGGSFFPLVLAGSAAGAACTAVLPMQAAAAMAAGLGAATALGMGKPIAVALIGVLLIHPDGIAAPLLVGVATAALLMNLLPSRWTTQPGH